MHPIINNKYRNRSFYWQAAYRQFAGGLMSTKITNNFVQLVQTFLEVCDVESVQKASQRLNLSPSAVSWQIKKLEEELGGQLFTRGKSGMKLTEKGLHFKREAILCFASIRDLRTRGREHKLSGPVTIGGINRFTQELIPYMMKFRALHPAVDFHLESITSVHYKKTLHHARHLDLYVGIFRETLPGITLHRLMNLEVYLFTPPNNPNSLPERPTWEQICKLPFVANERLGNVNPLLACYPAMTRPSDIHFTTDDFQLAIALVQSGYGCCMATRPSFLEESSGYSSFSLSHIFPDETLYLAVNENLPLSSQASAFIEFLKMECQKDHPLNA